MSSFPSIRGSCPHRASRRNLYRRCKRILYRFARPRWRGRAESLKRLISDFLRGKSLPFLLRVIRQHGLAMLLASALVAGTAIRAFAAIELSAIAQDANIGGFAINGINTGDRSGVSVSGVGDVNGDGLDDVIVGAYYADPGGVNNAGQSYVVFGKADGTAVDLSDVTAGTGGFAITGINVEDRSGHSVSGAGDVNGDGIDDLIVGAPFADPGGNSRAGQSYVIFGKADETAVDLSAVAAGMGGFAINGINIDDFSGRSVSGAGDVNGDGLNDLIVGAWGADPGGSYSGQSYVVFGKADGTTVELSAVVAGTGGFAINGISNLDFSGQSVSGAGDVNGDGLDDLIVGAHLVVLGGNADVGQAYVVFGKVDGTTVELSAVVAGTGGFAINGINRFDHLGRSVSGAGDVNGDGLDDVIVGAYFAGNNDAGQSYVVFGKTDGTAVDVSAVVAGTGGFAINGINLEDRSGRSVSGAGDVNGDGLDDLVIGAYTADPGGRDRAGQSYKVFGKADGTAVELSDVEAGIGGIAFDGIARPDNSGISVSGAGDVNGDGFDDVIIGAWNANSQAGQSYVVFCLPVAGEGEGEVEVEVEAEIIVEAEVESGSSDFNEGDGEFIIVEGEDDSEFTVVEGEGEGVNTLANEVLVTFDGSDQLGCGGEENPCETIQFAINSCEGTQENPITIRVGPGTFPGQIRMDPFESLVGAAREQTVILSSLSPVIQAADETAIARFTIRATLGAGEIACVDAVDITVALTQCTFDGGGNPQSMGPLLSGIASDSSMVADNVFQFLGTGLVAWETSVPIIRNHFQGLIIGVSIALPGGPLARPQTRAAQSRLPVLGTTGSPGMNSFRDIEGMLVENLNAEPVKAQGNDWGVYTEAEIAAKVTNTDFSNFQPVPLLGFLTGICSDAATKAAIKGASVEVTGAETKTLTTDRKGRYSSRDLAEGIYASIASATGFRDSALVDAEVFPGQTTELNFGLEKTGEGEAAYGGQAAMASGVRSLGSFRDLRDASLTGSRTGDVLTSVYYSRQANKTVKTALGSSAVTSLVRNVVYMPAGIFLNSGLLLKTSLLGAFGGLSLLTFRSLRRRRSG